MPPDQTAADDCRLPAIIAPGTLPKQAAGTAHQRSDVLRYEVELRQSFALHPTAPHPHRIATSLAVLHEIVGTLSGRAVQQVLATVRDEIHRSVYSQMLTAGAAATNHGGGAVVDASQDSAATVEQVPYFVVVARLLASRDADEQRHKQAVDAVEHLLRLREKEIQVINKRNFKLRQEVTELTGRLAALEARNADLQQIVSEYEDSSSTMDTDRRQLTEQHAAQVKLLSDRLDAANQTIEQMSMAKSAYRTLENKLVSAAPLASVSLFKRPYRDAIHSIVDGDVTQLDRMRVQINRVIAELVDEYDDAAERLFAEYTILRGRQQQLSDSSNIREVAEEKFSFESAAARRSFVAQLDACVLELKSVEEALAASQESTAKWKKLESERNISFIDWFKRQCHGVNIGVFIDGNQASLPLSAHGAGCTVCPDQLYLCPHVSGPAHISLPPNCNSIRMSHANKGSDYSVARHSEPDCSANDEKYEYLDDQVSRNMRRIWKDFYNRNGRRPMFPRKLSYQRLRWHVDQITLLRRDAEDRGLCSYFGLTQTNAAGAVEGGDSFLEFFYYSMNGLYGVEAAAFLAIYEVFCGLQHYELHGDDVIQLFVRRLAGCDDVVDNYMVLVDDLLDKVKIDQNVSNFRRALRLLYPYRAAIDFYDQLELDYISFTQNKIDSHHFRRYIMRQLAANQEANVFAIYSMLYKIQQKFHGQSNGMTMDEYARWLKQTYPPVPTRLVYYRMRILESNLAVPFRATNSDAEVKYPLRRLAILTSYFMIWSQKTWAHWAGIVAHLTVNGDALQDHIFNGAALTREILGGKSPYFDSKQLGQGKAQTRSEASTQQISRRRGSLYSSTPEASEADIYGWLDVDDAGETLMEQRSRWIDCMEREEQWQR